jgi:outer membrane protein TolC
MRNVGVFVAAGLALLFVPALARAQEKPEADAETVLKGDPSGFSSDYVAKRAAETSYTVKAYEEALRGASARVDEAIAALVPRVTTSFSYQRLSELTAPSLGVLVATKSAPGPILNINDTDPQNATFQAIPFSFPVILDYWNFTASLNIPISDYFLRLNHTYSAATKARDAARYDVGASRTKSAADGKITFYSWLRAKGLLVIARLALEDQKTHLTDTRNLATVGNATQVDVLRGETAVAASELSVVQAQNLVELTEKQLRIAMHIEDSVRVASSEPLDTTSLAPVSGTLEALINEAQAQRYEVKSIDANAEASRQQAKSSRNAAYPSLGGFGDVVVANPNQRLFPLSAQWFPTWDVGLRLSWSPNDIPLALAQAADFDSRAAGLDAQKQVFREGIAIEVTQAYQSVLETDFSLGSTAKQLASATEAVRVARELFKAGRVNSTTLTDAETDLTRARLQLLNARIEARTARVRLEHAVGRDNRLVQLPL